MVQAYKVDAPAWPDLWDPHRVLICRIAGNLQAKSRYRQKYKKQPIIKRLLALRKLGSHKLSTAVAAGAVWTCDSKDVTTAHL
jgi:hypothetical protein